MSPHTKDPPPNFTEYKLDLHFGGSHFPTQQDSLAHIAAMIMIKKPQTVKSLVEAFLDATYVPMPVTLEPEEAEWLLREGHESGFFVFEESTGLYSLTDDFHAELIERENQQTELTADIRDAFMQVLGTEPYVPQAYRPFLWECLETYVQHVALEFIQTATEQRSSSNGVQILRELVSNAPDGIDKNLLLDAAMAHFPAFIEDDPCGKALHETTFNHTMYAFRTSISFSGTQQMAEELGRYHLILDTNVMISAMGLRQNEDITTAVRRVLRMLADAGVTICYTSETEAELRRALKHAVDTVERDNAVLARRGPDGNTYYPRYSIFAAYYAQRHLYPKEDFISRYTNLPARLSRDLDRDVEYLHITSEEHESLVDTADYDELYDRIARDEVIPGKAHHDALHLALVMRLRRRNRDKRYWFITQHHLLTDLNLDPDLPAPATRLEWIFMNLRQFLPRVDNFPEFVHGFVASKFFSSFHFHTEDLAERRLYIQNAEEREPGEILHSIFLKAKPHVFNKIKRQFGPDQAYEAYHALKDHHEQEQDAMEAMREQDRMDAEGAQRRKEAERKQAELQARKQHQDRYDNAIEHRERIKREKAALELKRISAKVITGVIAAGITALSIITRMFDFLPLWAEIALLLAPVFITGVVFVLIDAKANRDRLALSGELDIVLEKISEMKSTTS